MRWIVWHSRIWFTVVLALASCTCTFSFFRSFFIYRVMPLDVVFFFFLFKRVFPVYFSQSVPYAHTLSRSHCLLLLLLSANSSPFHSFLYTPLFFSTSFETHPPLPSLHQPDQSMSFTGILLQPLLMGDWDVCPLIGW